MHRDLFSTQMFDMEVTEEHVDAARHGYPAGQSDDHIMKTPRSFSIFGCMLLTCTLAAHEYAAVVEHIQSELSGLRTTGLNASHVHELRQWFQDIRKWPEHSADIGTLSRRYFLEILAAQEKDPGNEHAHRALYSTITTLWADYPALDDQQSAAITDQFLQAVATSYTKIRHDLASIKPGTRPNAPHVPESHLGKYFSGPPPRPQDIIDETDGAAYEKDYNRYIQERDTWLATLSAPHHIKLLDRAMGDLLLTHPNRAIGKTEGRMAFLKMTGIPKEDQEKLVCEDP